MIVRLNSRKVIPCILATTLTVFSNVLLAAETDAGYDGFQLFIENDKFSGFKKTDQWYTNGLRLVVLPREVPFAAGQKFADIVGYQLGTGTPARFGLTFGQDIYTPRNIADPNPQPFDRPWAGWLYFGLLGQLNSAAEKMQTTAELDIGVVGPASGAKWAQTTVHRLIDAQEPAGWNNQIKNELGVVLSVRRKHRFEWVSDAAGQVDIDFIPQYGASVGNVFTNLAGGAMIRIGSNLSGFGDDRLTNAVEGSPTRRPFNVSEQLRIKEWYFFIRTEGRLVGRNIFLDGNTFSSEVPSVKRKPLVIDGSLGASVRMSSGLRLTYVHNRRSSEYKRVDERTPKGTARYGTLILAYEF